MICWNSTAVTRALEELSGVSGAIQNAFAELLNDYHGAAGHRSDYWDLVGGEWLLGFTHVAYAAYREVLLDNVPQVRPVSVRVFSDGRSFQAAQIEDATFFSELRGIVSALLESEDRSSWNFSQSIVPIGIAGHDLKQRTKQLLARIVSVGIGSSVAPFVICHPYVKCGRSEWLGALWKWRKWARQDNYYYPISTSASIDRDWRLKRSADVSVMGFASLMAALLPLYIPVFYLEGFAEYRRRAMALGLARPRALYTANSLHGHSLFKTLAAEWREEGTNILCHQHGGGYGMERIHVIEEYETRVSDRFFTLGWHGQSPKQVPLTGAALHWRRYSGEVGKRCVLLCCTIYPKNVRYFHFQPLPGTIEKMFADTIEFATLVHQRGKLQVRTHRLDWGWNFNTTLRSRIPGLCFDDQSLSGRDSFARASLVVHNYLGSSWLETLVMNVPTVCFFDPNTYAFRDTAQPYIDRLKAVGILHCSGSEAAKFVTAVMIDPGGWWQGSEVQDARRHFVERYALFTPNWIGAWEAEFGQWV
jgi:putative transferase (TIGR04331 family)